MIIFFCTCILSFKLFFFWLKNLNSAWYLWIVMVITHYKAGWIFLNQWTTTNLTLQRKLRSVHNMYLGLSKGAGCRRKSWPTWLVSAGYSDWHFFTDGIFLNKISLDWPLTLTTQLAVCFKTFWQPCVWEIFLTCRFFYMFWWFISITNLSKLLMFLIIIICFHCPLAKEDYWTQKWCYSFASNVW